jgi:hypothetical protein
MQSFPYLSSLFCLLVMGQSLTAAPVAVTGMQRSGNQILGLTVNGVNISRGRLRRAICRTFFSTPG